MKSLKTFISIAMAGFSVVACAHKSAPYAGEEKSWSQTKEVSQEALYTAEDNNASFVTELEFEKGVAQLSPKARERISRMVSDAETVGQIDDIKVITWADKEYPSANAKKLSKQQRNLASERNAEIKKFLRQNDDKFDVETYNMAERPDALQRFLKTDSARLKKSLEVAGIPTTSSVGLPQKASKSMVLVIMKE